jgi:hypothetical protein
MKRAGRRRTGRMRRRRREDERGVTRCNNGLDTRLKAHFSSIEDKVVGQHFQETHSPRQDLIITPIMTVQVNNPLVRLLS